MYNSYPTAYNYGMSQPYYGYNQQPSQAPVPTSSYGINWVQGESGAKSFHVDPGQSAWLMDSEEMVGYLKSVANNGMPLPLEVYDLVKRPKVVATQSYAIEQKDMDLSGYVKREDIEEIVTSAIDRRMADYSPASSNKRISNRKETIDA